MFLFLYGEDNYRSLRKLREIVGEYKKVHKTGLNLIYFDCLDSDFGEFENSVKSISMFLEKKLIILRNVFLNPNFKEKLLKWAKISGDKGENIIVVFQNQSVKKTDSLFRFLKTNSRAQEFNFLAGKRLSDWVDAEFQKYGAQIDSQARTRLIDFVGSDLWQMSQEIMKLCAYKQNNIIQAKDVDLLVSPKISADIFHTIDKIAGNDKPGTLALLRRHLRKGDSPLYLLSMINFQFRNLLVIKDFIEKQGNIYGSIKIPGMHPYVARKSAVQSRNFSFERLKKIYRELLAIDSDIKTGRITQEAGLEMLIIGI